ncbi:dihydrodipicolinate synthase family protein [Cryobacterium algoricola]|uniref:Dihydrodipicolinate synthase family protein n=1 Tax=Cryobacterium algoricola TaxID=1259183 RepID=A0ABY2IHT2_9MICO|nr:dihydrodipicolinate synthase family protein [Cryobacterium algoricola]
MFSGLSAFPLTPLTDEMLDEASYSALVASLASAGVDSIGALGSTGSYAYLSRPERARIAELAVDSAQAVPVIIGVGALRTRDVLANVEDAQNAGASGVLLAPLAYQPLSDDEVYRLYAEVAASLSVPLVVYDNPVTTHFAFSDELHGRIAQLPAVASIKIPGVSADLATATARVDRLRALIPERVTIGISGDGSGVTGMLAGCDAWYSVLAGVFPHEFVEIAHAAHRGDAELARARADRFAPLWALFASHGSYRVTAAVAEDLGIVGPGILPRPVRGLDPDGRAAVAAALDAAGLRR